MAEFDLFEQFQAAEDVEIPLAEDRHDCRIFDILEMHPVQPVAEPIDGFDGIFVAAEIMPGIDARADAGVTPFDHVDDIIDFIVFRLGAVVVDGDVDFVFLHEFIEQVERRGVFFGICAERFDADRFGEVEEFAGLCFVSVERHHAEGNQLDTRFFDQRLAGGDLFGDRGDRDVLGIGFPIMQPEHFGDLQRFLHVETAQ